MSRQAISVTLDADNITWLKGRAGAGGLRSLSELLNRIVTTARQSKSAPHARSVVGTVTICPDDPDLREADVAIQALYNASLGGSSVIRDKRSADRQRRRGPRSTRA
jgi:hypothetical protein